MNNDQVKGKWLEMKGEVLNKWGKLTSDEYDKSEGNLAAIAGMIQQHYGEAREAISETLHNIFGSAKETVEQAKNDAAGAVSDATEDAKDALRRTEPNEPNLN